MRKRSRTTWIALAVAAAVSVAGCDLRLERVSGGAPAAVPVAAGQTTGPAPLDPQGPGEIGSDSGPVGEGAGGVAEPSTDPSPSGSAPGADATAPDQPAPVPTDSASATAVPPTAAAPPPTVAKRQKWVKIFSGPSEKDIVPPASRTEGSRTVELNAIENNTIGTYVADGAGRTLYRFDADSNNPPKSTCNGDCRKAWPPLLIKSPGRIFPDGVDPQLVGYVERADGTCQVTIDGWPVYYFIADAKPGDINGQGVNGKWFAVAPTGGKTKAIPGFPLKTN